MKKRILLLVAVILIGLPLVGVQAQAEQEEALLLTATGPLTPAMAEYLDRGLDRALRQGAAMVIFALDTPGGQVDLMNRMVQAMRSSPIPVVVYITPRGAIAGSAGTVLTLAGHAAAMAPETAIGAASPVSGQGQDLTETIETKQKEILKAEVRSLAAHRGPEAVALAEATIEEAKAASALEAYEVGLIDFVASDVDDLLQQLDGFQVQLVDRTQTLDTSNISVVEVPQTFIEQLLQTLTNPNIVFLLITVGVQAVLIELSSPGGWIAGFIGVVCLALGAYGIGVLPVNWFGIIFILTAFVLFFLEIKAPTHGALAIAGIASFIVGGLVLFNSPGTPDFLRVSVPLVIGTGLVTAAIFLSIVTFAMRAQMRRVTVGAEALIGAVGQARTDLAPTGTVHVAGELWSAVLVEGADMVPAGSEVVVEAVQGLRLQVRAREVPSG